jgi:hypothetical protein
VRENYQEKVTQAVSLWGMGVPFNDINERLELGFKDIEGGDDGWIPMSLLPVSSAAKPPAGDEGDQGLAEDEGDGADAGDEGDAGKSGSPRSTKAVWSEEQKSRYWKVFDRRRVQWEKQVRRQVAKRFSVESSQVVKAYEETEVIDAAMSAQAPSWKNLFLAVYASVMEDFGRETGRQLTGKARKPSEIKEAAPEFFVFDPWAPNTQRWVAAVTATKVTQILDTTKRALKIQIAAGLAEGEGIAEIAKRLRTVYEEFSTRRSMVIARTECVAASNAGSHFSAEQTGLSYDRVWLSSRDDRVRDDHTDMDGQAVAKDEPFTAPDGSKLMFPGDTSLGASAAQTIECRCSEIFEVE